MTVPVVGICAAVERARWASWDVEIAMAPRTYATAVQAAGGLALILPPDPAVTADPDRLLEHLDGLLVAGGSDVDPASYGAEPAAETTGHRADRDSFELALLRRAIERDMPTLGICRGMQMLNVARGGTIDQHLPDSIGGSVLHREVAGTFSEHDVDAVPGSLAERALGSAHAAVKSHHHQGVGRLGDGIVVTGRSSSDEVIEAIELPGCSYALGVLWHPEEDPGSGVIGSLVEEARMRSDG